MDPQAQAQQRVGTTLCNKWTLERLLGVGGMAAVYVAVNKIGRRDAIKILHAEVAKAPDIRARFEQEAMVGTRFRHPGAVEIRDMDVAEDGAPFLVMELLEGESLAERARRLGGIELAELLRFADELLDVLVVAHQAGIVHRDIKLDNLFIQRDGRLKILDFGIARVRDGLPTPLRTRLGATLGTASYMPPEQVKGMEIDARADLFAVGATLFRLIARRRLHEAATETDMLLKMATEPPPPLLAVAPDAPPDVALVVDRALMYQRDRRYPDAATMQRDIRALRAGEPPPFATTRRNEPDSPHSLVTAIAPPLSAMPTQLDVPAASLRAAAAPSAAVASDAPTRVGAPAAVVVAGAPVSSDAPTRVGDELGTRPTAPALPKVEAPRTVNIVDPPTIQRPGAGAAPKGAALKGTEQTLQSAQAPVIASPAAKPPPVSVRAAGPAGPAQGTGPLGAKGGTILMPPSIRGPAATGVSPTEIDPGHPPREHPPQPVVAIVPAPPLPKKRRLLAFAVLGGVFFLLGVGGVLFWMFQDDILGGAATGDANASADPGGAGKLPLRPRSTAPAPAPAKSGTKPVNPVNKAR